MNKPCRSEDERNTLSASCVEEKHDGLLRAAHKQTLTGRFRNAIKMEELVDRARAAAERQDREVMAA